MFLSYIYLDNMIYIYPTMYLRVGGQRPANVLFFISHRQLFWVSHCSCHDRYYRGFHFHLSLENNSGQTGTSNWKTLWFFICCMRSNPIRLIPRTMPGLQRYRISRLPPPINFSSFAVFVFYFNSFVRQGRAVLERFPDLADFTSWNTEENMHWYVT